jgi:outer membrane protein insertion porin family
VRRLVVLHLLLIVCFGSSVFAQMSERERLRWLRSKPRITAIEVTGTVRITPEDTARFTAEEVRSRLYAKTYSLWRRIKGDRRIYVQRETLGRDTLELAYLYLTNGFLGLQVDHSFERLDDGTAKVVVDVHEGRPFTYDSVVVSGEYPGVFGFEFRKKVRDFKPGKPINIVDLKDLEFVMKEFLANRGYPYTRIGFTIDTLAHTDRATVRFRADAGEKVHFGPVSIRGVEDYPVSVARRELTIDSGEVYSRREILRSRQRLFESGYFTTVQLNRATDIGDSLNPRFALSVRERKTHYVSAELGAVGQSNLRDLAWQTSAGFGKRDLLGSRRGQFEVSYYFSLLGADSRILENKYSLKFTEPWLVGFRVPLTLGFEWEPTLRDPDFDFKRTAWAASAELLFRYGREVRLTLGGEYESLKLSDFPEDQSINGLSDQTSGRRKLYTELRVDSRDNQFVPTRGQNTQVFVEYFGGFMGGDDDFWRVQSSWATYQIVWPGWVGAVRVKAGFAKPFGDSDSLLTDDLLLTGGASSVRSFRENRLGPLDDEGDPIGARYMYMGNIEFRWKTLQIFKPVPILKTFPLWQSLFIDIGNAARREEDIRLNRIAIAYGTGIQLISPAGPIRLDWAARIPTKAYDYDSRWHFTILYPF